MTANADRGTTPGDDKSSGIAEDGYIRTAAQNLVSRSATIWGARNVELRGKSVVEAAAEIRGGEGGGDGGAAAPGAAGNSSGGKIRIGRYCHIGRGCVIEPAYVDDVSNTDADVTARRRLPLVIGSNTSVGPNCLVRAAAIGSSVIIGRDCTLGNRSIVKDCCLVEDGTILPPDTVVPPFSVVRSAIPGKSVGRIVDELPESCAVEIPARRLQEFGAFVAAHHSEDS
jgi:dynactin-5